MDDGNFGERDGGLLVEVGLGDRYQYQKTLGNKAGRTTLLAQDLETQELVVIKLLTFSDEFQWEDLRLFEREIQTLRSIDHPAIPQYLDNFEIDTPQGKSMALVQSYIPAKSLEDYLVAGREFPELEVQELLNALLDILIYLHDRHPPLIHRDIKPSNILLGDRTGHSIGKVYLVDFGSVQTLATRAGQTMTVVGTYGYMPPEQFGGNALPASDLYSLGCTALNLITGSHPADLPQRDLQIQFADYVDLSPGLIQWLQKATHPSLDRRFSQASIAKQELNHPLDANPHSLSLASKQPTNSSQLFWMSNFLWRSTVLGAVTGGIYGGMFGTGIFPIAGTLFGAAAGGVAGFFLGFFNGILLTIFTYFLSNKGKYYPYWMGGLGFVGSLAGFGLASVLSEGLNPGGFFPLIISMGIPVLIAALSMGLIGYTIARWYQKHFQ